MHNNSPEKNGFTLVEIITSIALLAMVVAVMLPIFPQLMSWSSQSEDQLVTSNLLGQAVEYVQDPDNAESFNIDDVKACGRKMIDVESNEPETYKYKVGDHTYTAEFKMCREEKVDLLRTKVLILTPQGKRHSETYTYIKAGGRD